MTRAEMIEFLKTNHNIPVFNIHLTDDKDGLYSKEDGSVWQGDYRLPDDWADYFYPVENYGDAWYVKGDKTGTENCNWHIELPGHGTCCDYYYHTVDSYGQGYSHFPTCECLNCPIQNPALLKGRKLESEITCRTKTVKLIPHTERDGKVCYFCGTSLSVKYIVEVDMPKKAPSPFRANSCNKCALVKIR